MAGIPSGFGLQSSYPAQQTAWGLSPFAGQGLPQTPQLLQIIPQQIQQLQYLQQQQLQILQHLIQVVPQQLQQIQQVIQSVPLQIQHLQQQLQTAQPSFGQGATGFGPFAMPGLTSQAFGGAFQTSPFLGQGFPGQPGHVM